MKTYFASGFGELEVTWRWFGCAGLLLISAGFCKPSPCTGASAGWKAALSITAAVANGALQQTSALGSAEQLSEGGIDLETLPQQQSSPGASNYSAPTGKPTSSPATPSGWRGTLVWWDGSEVQPGAQSCLLSAQLLLCRLQEDFSTARWRGLFSSRIHERVTLWR